MDSPPPSRDLVVLVPDRNMEAGFHGILVRPEALSIRSIDYQIFVHPDRDPGCFLRGHTFLVSQLRRFSTALVIFDRVGCGREDRSRADLEAEVELRLRGTGWEDRAGAICIDPELENWVWSNSPNVDSALGWESRHPDLRSWLSTNGFLLPGVPKPSDPKMALEAALYEVRKPRSSSIYRKIAQEVSLVRCRDSAFRKLRELLRTWFPR